MREELAKRAGLRGLFRCRVGRFGKRKAYKGPPIETVLVRNVRDGRGDEVTDHLWFDVGKQMRELNLHPGDEIEFEARVATYEKGYKGRRQDDDLPQPQRDYELKFPRKFRKLNGEQPNKSLPLFEENA